MFYRFLIFLFISLIFISCSEEAEYIPVTTYSLSKISKQAYKYCKAKKFNTEICFLVDMRKHSGLKRFYVWDLKKGKAIDSGMVSHGCGDNDWNDDDTKTSPVFSNMEDSHCSSLGKYRIGERGKSQWGIGVKYSLYGLEKTNKLAMKRAIVLHSWKSVPDKEIFPDGTPEGWGCPAVSNNFMKQIDAILQKSGRPVLLWVIG